MSNIRKEGAHSFPPVCRHTLLFSPLLFLTQTFANLLSSSSLSSLHSCTSSREVESYSSDGCCTSLYGDSSGSLASITSSGSSFPFPKSHIAGPIEHYSLVTLLFFATPKERYYKLDASRTSIAVPPRISPRAPPYAYTTNANASSLTCAQRNRAAASTLRRLPLHPPFLLIAASSSIATCTRRSTRKPSRSLSRLRKS